MTQMNELVKFDKKNKTKKYLIGTDEVGRGPGAGPVYAAAVCFIKEPKGMLLEINDSKKIPEAKREQLAELIKKNAIYSIKSSSVTTINNTNVLKASLRAMKLACNDVVKQLGSEDVNVIVDGNQYIQDFKYEQETVKQGDTKSISIAAASIIAKVERDKLMRKLSKSYPQYLWTQNKGYLTLAHIAAIEKYGLTVHHRDGFVRKIVARMQAKAESSDKNL